MVITFDESATQPRTEVNSSNTYSVRRRPQGSLRQSIVGRMSTILFGRPTLTFDDQVSRCKCAPMDKAMGHPRKSELGVMADVDFSESYHEEDEHIFNSDEAKAKHPQQQDFVSSFWEGFAWITATEEEIPPDGDANKNDNGEQALGNHEKPAIGDLEAELLGDDGDGFTYRNSIIDQLGTFWTTLLMGDQKELEDDSEEDMQ